MALDFLADPVHCSVLPEEVLRYLAPRSGGVYVDGTLGLGGHTEAVLRQSSPAGRVIAFEWDEEAIARSRIRLQPFADRLIIVRRNFAEIGASLSELNIKQVDGILVDIGLSSLQLDMGGRGFSFQRDEPLDMRMDTRREVTAALLLATCSEKELADIFFYYGDEKQARPIAREIVQSRFSEKILTSGQLAIVVARAIPRRFHPEKIHVATKVFQALRIAVNSELENLARLLGQAPPLLRTGARFCVISFHSLEDRLVKRKFREQGNLEILTPKPVIPTQTEIAANPRSRSARLRVAVKK
jgi:16S rRNA (cytosine1402-N4)-methyltransferase